MKIILLGTSSQLGFRSEDTGLKVRFSFAENASEKPTKFCCRWGFICCPRGEGWESTNLENHIYLFNRGCSSALKNQNTKPCHRECGFEVHDCIRGLVAHVCLWPSSKISAPPPHESCCGARCHQELWLWGALLLPEAAYPSEMVHLHPAQELHMLHITRGSGSSPAAPAAPCKEAVMGLESNWEEMSWLQLDLSGFKDGTCLENSWPRQDLITGGHTNRDQPHRFNIQPTSTSPTKPLHGGY